MWEHLGLGFNTDTCAAACEMGGRGLRARSRIGAHGLVPRVTRVAVVVVALLVQPRPLGVDHGAGVDRRALARRGALLGGQRDPALAAGRPRAAAHVSMIGGGAPLCPGSVGKGTGTHGVPEPGFWWPGCCATTVVMPSTAIAAVDTRIILSLNNWRTYCTCTQRV